MTIQLFNSILTMTTILKLTTDINSLVPKSTFFNIPIISNRYIVKYNNYETIYRNSIIYHNLKCWKSYCIFNNYINNYNDDNMIFSLDFNINKDDKKNPFIKIDYLYVNNDYNDLFNYKIKTNLLLNYDETKTIIKSLINYIENWGIKKNINKIIIDINSNLGRYNYELKDLGFIPTDKKCLFNPSWIEAEKIINSN